MRNVLSVVYPLPSISKVPFAPPWFEGLASVQGEIIPVVNTSLYFFQESVTDAVMLVLCESHGYRLGFLVTQVNGIHGELERQNLSLNSSDSSVSWVGYHEEKYHIPDFDALMHEILSISYQSTWALTDSPKDWVLCVDDSAWSRQWLCKLMSDLGFAQSFSAEDGFAAWQILLQNLDKMSTLKAIVIDAEMPHMNGLTLIARIRQDHRFAEIPVILYSAHSASIFGQDWAHSIGVQAFVEKFDQRALTDALSKYMNIQLGV